MSSTSAPSGPPRKGAAKIQPLPPDTVSSITSGQIIVDVASAVKELIENSIDAGATAITVTLIDHGRKSIAVTDNGSGIAPQDRPCMARRYYTSKLRTFADLESVSSLGFRGEALHSLATLCQSLTVTTRTASDKVAAALSVDSRGEVVATKIASATVGTSVCATNLFHMLPVRRTTLLKKKENLKPLLHAYAMAYPLIQFTLVDGSDRWVKPASKTLRDAIGSVHGRAVADGCLYLNVRAIDHIPETPTMTECTLTVVVPTVAALAKDSKPFATKPPLYILNHRPIKPPRTISQAVKSHLERAGCRSAFHLIAITLPQGTFDINVDPAKSQIMSECVADLVTVLDRVLGKTYEPMLAENAAAAAARTSNQEQERAQFSYLDPPPPSTAASAAAAVPPTPPRTSSSQPAPPSPGRPSHQPSTPLLTQPAPRPRPTPTLSSLAPTPLIHAFHQRAIQPVAIHSLLTPRASGWPAPALEPLALAPMPSSGADAAAQPSVHRMSALASNYEQDEDEEDELVVPRQQPLRPLQPKLPVLSNSSLPRPSAALSSTPAVPQIGGLFTPSKSPRTPGGGALKRASYVSPSQVRLPRASQAGPSQGGAAREPGQTTLFAYLGKKGGRPRASQADRVLSQQPPGAAVAAASGMLELRPVSHLPAPPRPPSPTRTPLPPAQAPRPLSVSIDLAAIRDHLLAAPNAQSVARPVAARKVVGALVGEQLQVVLVDGDVVWVELVGREARGVPVWSIVGGWAVGEEDV